MPDHHVKLDRADVHLDSLDGVLDQFIKHEPYELETYLQSDTGYYVVRLKSRKEVPVWFSAVVGDVLFNLRSALDQLAYALATKGGPLRRPQDSAFPILKDKPRTWPPEAIKHVGVAAKAEIEGLQPYRSAKPLLHPLWLLHDLNRSDKHRLLHIVNAIFAGTNIYIERVGYDPVLAGQATVTGRLEDGADIIKWRQPIAGPGMEMKVNAKPICEIRFDKGSPAVDRLVSDTLHGIRDHVVRNVVPPLEALP